MQRPGCEHGRPGSGSTRRGRTNSRPTLSVGRRQSPSESSGKHKHQRQLRLCPQQHRRYLQSQTEDCSNQQTLLDFVGCSWTSVNQSCLNSCRKSSCTPQTRSHPLSPGFCEPSSRTRTRQPHESTRPTLQAGRGRQPKHAGHSLLSSTALLRKATCSSKSRVSHS